MITVPAAIETLVDKSLKEIIVRIAADKARAYSISEVHYDLIDILKEVTNSDITKIVDVWNVDDHYHARAISEDYVGVSLNLTLGEVDY